VKCCKKLQLDGDLAHTVAYSKDGKLITAGLSKTVEGRTTFGIGVWSAESGKPQSRLAADDSIITSIDMSYDNSKVGASAGNHQRMLWDLGSQSIERRWFDRDGSVIVFHPRSALWAFSSCGDSTREGLPYVYVENYVSGHRVWSCYHKQTIVHCICFSPDGSTIVTGTQDGNVHEWSAENGKLKKLLRGHRCPVYCVAYSPSSDLIASAGWKWVDGQAEGEIILWKGEERQVERLPPIHTRIHSLLFSRDGRFLIVSGGVVQGELSLWDTATRQPVWRGGSRFHYWAVASSPTEDRFAAAGHEDAIEIWDFSGLQKNK
jgi:WD40 repeat protein